MVDRIESIDDLQDKLSGMQVAMVTTGDERGLLSSRPVTMQALDDDGNLWFLVDRHSSWVAPADGAAVNAAFTGERGLWVSFAGRVALDGSTQRIAELLDAMSDTFFENDAEPIALRVTTDQVEWWVAPNTAGQVLDLVRAKVTNRAPEAGESGTLEAG